MTKTELESKHLSELHSLAAEAGIPRYRMLRREELVEKLADGGGGGGRPRREPKPKAESRPERRDRGRRRERRPARPEPPARERSEPEPTRQPQREAEPPRRPEPAAAAPQRSERPKRKRRRRFRRRGRKAVRVHELLLAAAPGRQAIVYAETREGCTALLRELAAELTGASKGPDPIALLVDPSPEELGDWRREAPQAEIVAAGQARHADDAIAQATRRAEAGEDVIVLVDSLSRFAESFGDADEARGLFDSGLSLDRSGNGSLTVVAAVERPS